MKFLHNVLRFLLLVFAAAAFVALFLGARWLVGGTFKATEAPLFWFWDNIVVYGSENRWWDPLLAAGWMLLPAATILSRTKYHDLEWAPVYGLAAAGAIYLVFWGEPGVFIWLLMAPATLITGRITSLIDERSAAADGHRLKNRYGFIEASAFAWSFGLGMLLPLALMHGFLLATFIWWIYALSSLFICLSVFGVLYAPRPFTWLFQKIRARYKRESEPGNV